MPKDAIESRVKEIIADQLGLAEEDVQPTSSFADDLGADALDFAEIIMSFEEDFGREIDDEDAAAFKTVQDAIDFLRAPQ